MGGRLFDAVLFDRDGTLVQNVPYHGDQAVALLHEQGLAVGTISPQPGVAKPGPGMVHAAAAELGTVADRCVVIGDIGSDIAAGEAAGAATVLVPNTETDVAEIATAATVARDLTGAVDRILARQRLITSPAEPARPGARVLAVRTDSAGDVLQIGPALRAIAARAGELTLLAGPHGASAARLLPGVSRVFTWRTPWIDANPPSVDRDDVLSLVDLLRRWNYDEAIVFTSLHQSALPFALISRMAGIGKISAICSDYPGSLLDLRHHVPDDLPEPERALSLAAHAGYPLPERDDGRLRLAIPWRQRRANRVVVHPGGRAGARTVPPETCRDIVAALAATGREILVTGGPDEAELTARVARGLAEDLGGNTNLAELAELISSASCVVVGNTGPAHVAAATGTPVISLFAPTVPWSRWGPYRTPRVRLGDPQDVVRAADMLAGGVR